MVHVWIHPTAGKALFIDDQLIPPCNTCGKRVSVCQQSDCKGEHREAPQEAS